MKKTKDVHYWRWHFLRLNAAYVADYEAAEMQGIASKPSNQDLNRFREEYGITGIVDYKLELLPKGIKILGAADYAVKLGSIEKIYEGAAKTKNQNVHSPFLYEYVLAETQGKKKRLEEIKERLKRKGISDEWIGYAPPIVKAIQVVINLEASIGDIQSDLHELIERYAKDARCLSDAKRIEKYKIADLKRYLNAYQLRNRKRKLTYKKIAVALDVEDDIEKDRNQEMAVKSYLKVAKRLIRGDYQKITL